MMKHSENLLLMVIKVVRGVLFILLVVVLLIVCIVVMQRERLSRERLSSFECGFDRFKTARIPFSLHFFLITIIFLVFDLEVLLIIPFIFFHGGVGLEQGLVGRFFFLVLIGGLVHEINEGRLEWR